MPDLLDVLHVMFEDASSGASREELEAREDLRKSIYTQLYGYKEYNWVTDKSKSASAGGTYNSDMLPDDAAVDTTERKLTHKPYVPPTPINVDSPLPIAGLKEAPLG
jgi:hypothetical protein